MRASVLAAASSASRPLRRLNDVTWVPSGGGKVGEIAWERSQAMDRYFQQVTGVSIDAA
ncbi:hypothetical protein GCM10012279_22540 [Micromonospora yangpuensis]|nr:hypothetical protein GCM10012279_22540 [Micromonospora yangpuensis]